MPIFFKEFSQLIVSMVELGQSRRFAFAVARNDQLAFFDFGLILIEKRLEDKLSIGNSLFVVRCN